MAAILLVLLYRLIFVFSGQDGEESGSLSAMISEKCAELLNAISGKHWTQNVLDSMAAYFEHPIRKLAHFSEYACMGVLLYGVWRPWKERGRKLYLLIVCWVFVSAGADEFHQLFIPGRYGCFADVVLAFPDYDGMELEVKLLLDTLHTETPALPKELNDKLFYSVLEDYADITVKRERMKKMKADPHYNALQVKYAYAVTCHKAQGGQWKRVFLDQGYMTENMLTPDYFRWLYTAFTRATEILYLVNWPKEQTE